MFDFGLTTQQENRARKLHKECIVIDMLDVSEMTDDCFRRRKQGGTTAISHTIEGPPGPFKWSYDSAIAVLA